jgi:putative NADPH-quinone reductase
MKTLVILVHPNLENSSVNKRWRDELRKYPSQYVVHDLHQVYPDEKIDIAAEQRLIEAHDAIVFQFPFYWFNCPPFLKKWLDEVLTYGWAYGSTSGYKLADKTIALGITAGIDEVEYAAKGRYKYSLQELTTPFELTFNYVKANYQSFYAFYGAEFNLTKNRLEDSVEGYMNFLGALRR